MPSKKSLRTSRKNAAYNRPISSTAKTLVREEKDSIIDNSSSDDTSKKLISAISALDKAAQKGVLHKNTVARKKSRLSKMLASSKVNK